MALAKFDEEIRESYYERMREYEWRRMVNTSVTSSSAPYDVAFGLSRSRKKLPPKEKDYQDKVLLCRGCGCLFTFSAKEQLFYAKKNFVSPKRCKSCRSARNVAAVPVRVEVWRYVV